MIRRIRLDWLPPAIAAGLAALWPLSAYAVSPLVLPALLVVAGVAIVVLRRPEYGIAVALALTPLTNLVVGGAKPFQVLLVAMAFGLAIYAALLSPRARELRTSRGLSIAVILFVAVALASSAQALVPADSVKKVFILLSAAALFFAVIEICQDRAKLIVVAGGAVAALVVAGVHGVAQHYLGITGVAGFVVNGVLVHRVQGAFGHPNQYGGYVAFLIPVAAAVLLTKAFPAVLRWLALFALVFGLPALVLSYARGALLGLFIGSLVWLVVLRPKWALVVAVVVAVAGTTFAPATLRERLNPSSASADVPLRADIWGAALQIYSGHPILGVGVNNFSDAYKQLPSTLSFASQRRFLDQQEFITPPHAQNLYLNVLAEEGIVGIASLALLALMSVLVLYRGSRIEDPAGRAVCLGGGAGLLAIGVHSILEVTLFSELALPFFALLAVAGTFVALDRGTTKAPARAN